MSTHARQASCKTEPRQAHRFRLDERILDKVLRINPNLGGDTQSLAEVKNKLLQQPVAAQQAHATNVDHTTLGLFLRGATESWSHHAKELQDRRAALQAEAAQARAQLRNSIECFLRVVPSAERGQARSLIEKHADLLSAVGLSPRDALNHLNK